MNTRRALGIALCLSFAVAADAGESGRSIDGVFGFSPIPTDMSVALWVPLGEGDAISGIRWYNNDGRIVFPEILGVAGEYGRPELLASATVIGEAVAGRTSDWSEYYFSQPIGSETSGLYLIIRIPVGAEYESIGEGFGLGFWSNSSESRCWVGTDAQTWNSVKAEHQMAVEAIMATNKAAGALRLRRVTDVEPVADTLEDTTAPEIVAGMAISPNPFNPQTEIRFALPQADHAYLVIFDVRGRKICTLVATEMSAGEHVATWEGRDDNGRAQPSGVYLACLRAGAVNIVKRVTLLQ